MEVSDVSSISSKVQTFGSKTLGKEDFMRLLLKQLSYQDPLNPMDSTEFTAQLTQFSSLEQLSNINSTLSDVLAFQHSMQNASMANMIGRTIRVPGSSAYLGDTADISYHLSREAAEVKISVYDGAGRLVVTKEMGPQPAGRNSFIWDGRDRLGARMPEGHYTFDVEAKDSSDGTVAVVTDSFGMVTGVDFRDGGTYLVLNDGRSVHLSDIQSIQ